MSGVVATFSGLLELKYGWSAFAAARDALPASAAAQERQAPAALPHSEYPHTAAVAEEMAAYASDHNYELVLHQLMVGIVCGSPGRESVEGRVSGVNRCVQSSAAAG